MNHMCPNKYWGPAWNCVIMDMDEAVQDTMSLQAILRELLGRGHFLDLAHLA